MRKDMLPDGIYKGAEEDAKPEWIIIGPSAFQIQSDGSIDFTKDMGNFMFPLGWVKCKSLREYYQDKLNESSK